MNKTALSLALLSLIPLAGHTQTQAETEALTLYGKANLDYQSSDEGDGSVTGLENNASRLGVKGSLPLNDKIKAVYTMEFGVDVTGDSDETFSKRVVFAGFEGGFGQVIGGRFDTALRRAQKKVDLFNDLEGDIGSIISRSENRESNTLQYSTPSFAGFKLTAAHLSRKDDVIGQDEIGNDIIREDGTSVALAYDNNGAYLAYGYDRDVEANGWNVQRMVAQYTIGPVKVGTLFEEQEKADGSTQDGWVASAAYKINQWTAKAQYGQSDIVVDDGETYSLGLDYKFSSAAKVYAFFTDETGADDYERSYFGVGTELKF